MSYLDNVVIGVKNQAAALMLSIGSTATSRCPWPLWAYEPEMPQSMLDEINNG